MIIEKIQILKRYYEAFAKRKSQARRPIISSLDQPDEKIDVLWRK